MKLPHYLDNQTLIMNTHNSFNRKTAPRKLNIDTKQAFVEAVSYHFKKISTSYEINCNKVS